MIGLNDILNVIPSHFFQAIEDAISHLAFYRMHGKCVKFESFHIFTAVSGIL